MYLCTKDCKKWLEEIKEDLKKLSQPVFMDQKT